MYEKLETFNIFMMGFPLAHTCASRDRRELIRNPNSVTRQTSDSPTVNNQGGLHLFSLTGGGANMIPVLIVAGIAMWLVWKGYRAFQQYENRKEARAPKATRDQLRREGEQLSSSDDNDDNGGCKLYTFSAYFYDLMQLQQQQEKCILCM